MGAIFTEILDNKRQWEQFLLKFWTISDNGRVYAVAYNKPLLYAKMKLYIFIFCMPKTVFVFFALDFWFLSFSGILDTLFNVNKVFVKRKFFFACLPYVYFSPHCCH